MRIVRVTQSLPVVFFWFDIQVFEAGFENMLSISDEISIWFRICHIIYPCVVAEWNSFAFTVYVQFLELRVIRMAVVGNPSNKISRSIPMYLN